LNVKVMQQKGTNKKKRQKEKNELKADGTKGRTDLKPGVYRRVVSLNGVQSSDRAGAS